jgi:hypothetical protein
VPILGVAEGQVVSTPEPGPFTEDWLAAWNGHDIDAVLAHFHDDVVFTSPIAARVVPESGGMVRGKAALRAYWNVALKTMPDLHFDVVGVYQGESVVVINYRNLEWRPGERGAGVRRRARVSRARDVLNAHLADRRDPGGAVCVHHFGAAAVGHRDRHDELKAIRAIGDLREIGRLELSPRPQRHGGLLQVVDGHRLRYPAMGGGHGRFHQHAHRHLGGVAGRDRVHGVQVVVDHEPFGHPHFGQAGSIRTTCGSTEAKYGTRAIAAAEKSRVPPARPESRRHAAYVLVGLVMPTYLTLE